MDSPPPVATAPLAAPLSTLPAAPRRRLLVIYNPTAGRRKKARLRQYLDLLEEAGCAIEFRPTTRRGDAEVFARDGLADRYDAVVAAGGDGTIAEVANGLPLEGAAPLGLLPLGTANVLAAELGLDLDPVAATRALRRGPARPIHPGVMAYEQDSEKEQKTRIFTIIAGVGFDARVVATLPPGLKRALGKGAYVLHSLWLLLGWRGPRLALEIDGHAHEAASAVIAKGHFYGGRFVCCPDARLEAPDFQICLLQRPGRLGALLAMAALPLGLLPRLPGVQLVRGREVRVSLLESAAGAAPGAVLAAVPGAEPVQADGDAAGCLPVRLSVRRAPLLVIAPAPEEKS